MLDEQQRKLVEDNLKLCHYALRKKDIPKSVYEDCFQIACIGLCKAAATFDPSLNHKFSTYAMKCIYMELFHNYRSQKRAKKQATLLSLDAPLKWSHGELYIRDIIPGTCLAEDSIAVHEIQDCIQTLSPRQRQAINLLLQGYNTAERAEAMGITMTNVGSATAKAREKLAEKLGIER